MYTFIITAKILDVKPALLIPVKCAPNVPEIKVKYDNLDTQRCYRSNLDTSAQPRYTCVITHFCLYNKFGVAILRLQASLLPMSATFMTSRLFLRYPSRKYALIQPPQRSPNPCIIQDSG